MSEEFFSRVETEKAKMPQIKKWESKVAKYLDSFEYANTAEMIRPKIELLTHVGINGMEESSEAIRRISEKVSETIDETLKSVTSGISEITEIFEAIEKSVNQKRGFFSKKESDSEIFAIVEDKRAQAQEKLGALNAKQKELDAIRSEVETWKTELVRSWILLDRDCSFLKTVKEFVKSSGKKSLEDSFKEVEFDVNVAQTESLSQQQVVMQKYAALGLLLGNVENCSKNVSYLARVTSGCMLNLIEIRRIASLNEASAMPEGSLDEVKAALGTVAADFKKIAQSPFKAYAR